MVLTHDVTFTENPRLIGHVPNATCPTILTGHSGEALYPSDQNTSFVAEQIRELHIRILSSMQLIVDSNSESGCVLNLMSLQVGTPSGSRVAGRKTRVARLKVSHIKEKVSPILSTWVSDVC